MIRIPVIRIPVTGANYFLFLDDKYDITKNARWWASLAPWELEEQVRAIIYDIKERGYSIVPEFNDFFHYIGGTAIFFGVGSDAD